MGVCSEGAKSGAKTYRPRHPEKTPFYAVLFRYFDEFKAKYEERYQKQYGRWRKVIDQVVGKFFHCGVLVGGFARIKCEKCGKEKLLALSCKGRGFCPSCSTKRALLWSEFVREKVLREVPHSHVVFTLPKIVRPYFRFHRELLPKLCICAWSALRDFFKASLSPEARPGAILTINTAGQFLAWNPHIHGLTTCGGFLPDGSFEPCPRIDANTVRELFEAHVFSMLREAGLISQELVDKVRSWRHSGFDSWIGPPVSDRNQVVQIGLYAVRAPAASGRLIQGDGPDLRYFAKGTIPDRDIGALFEPPSESFDYLDWIARLTSHIPEKGAQLVHYLGVYANASRARRTEGGQTESTCAPAGTALVEPESEWTKARKKSWARMIKRVWETDPLLCECGGQFKVISVIEARSQPAIVGKVLSHLHYVFEVLPLTPRPPPASPSPEPDPPPDDGEYCYI